MLCSQHRFEKNRSNGQTREAESGQGEQSQSEGKGSRCQAGSLSGGSMSKPMHSQFVERLGQLIIGVSERENIAKY